MMTLHPTKDVMKSGVTIIIIWQKCVGIIVRSRKKTRLGIDKNKPWKGKKYRWRGHLGCFFVSSHWDDLMKQLRWLDETTEMTA